MVPLFHEPHALNSYQARSWARQALNEGHSAVLFMCCGLLGWAGLELSLSTEPTGIQGPTGNKARRSTQLVAGVRREFCVLVHSSTDKICTESFLKRIWEENLYYTHKEYSVCFKIRNPSKVDLLGLEEMAFACVPYGHRAGSIQPETFAHCTFVLPKSSAHGVSPSLAVAVRDLPKSALNQGLNPDLLSLPYCSLTAKPVRYILKPLL